MEFPSESPQLEQLVERFRENGFPYRGRCYFFVSSSKADAYPHGPSAWLASPPSGGREQIDKQLGFNTIFKLEKAGDDIPNPGFRCRARVKQLFSSMIASIPVCKLEIEVIEDFKDVHGVIRDDGGGEADPDILEALAVASKTCQQEVGLCRSVTDSGQIRCAGLKGMLLGSKRLQGTRKLVVPRSMLKFGGAEFSQEHLSVLNFSKIRPTSLGQNVILRLEACGCDPKVLVEEQKRFLRKVTRMGQGDFREGAFHQLYFDKYETEVEAETQGHHVRGWSSKTYIGTFLEMLLSGFDPCQHPLLEVLLRQKKRALERAMKQVQLGGCWSARGHPEPQGEGNDLELTDNEIFLMVPSEAEEIGWTALTGHVIVNYLSDRDPHALRLALAKDSPALRAKCAPGVLYFSKQGRPLQVNLSWDFDGDYFQVITQQRLVNSFRGEDSANCFLPEFEAEMKDVEAKSLSDVHAHFLSEYHLKDRIGLHHYQWEMLAGEGPKAACSDQARRTAVAYSKSLDVEKGKPCPKLGKLARQPKWDFMKKPGGPQRPSPTAAGECYRQALQANQEFDEAKAPRNTSPDQDLSKAWKELLDQHGPQKCQKMKMLAKEVRGDFLKRVAIEINKAECAAGMGNSYTACYDELRGEWFLEMRKNVLRQAEKQDITPEQLALASWHLKYVDEGVCTECRDPNPSFPWLLFKAELSQCKEHWQPCLRSELYQFHGAMRKLQRNIGEASASERKKQKTDEAIECLKAKLKCPLCSATKNELLDKLHIPGPLLEAAAAVKGISGRGDVEYVDCERLRFAKAQFGDTLEHGKQSGTKLEELVDQLVRGEVAVRELVLTAVQFHGELYVVEGNRRLWCIKEAQRRLQGKLVVPVRVPNLYLGFIHRQEHKEPALPYFLQRYDPRFEGKRAEVFIEFTDDITVSVDMMFQMLRNMGFNLHYHEVRFEAEMGDPGADQEEVQSFREDFQAYARGNAIRRLLTEKFPMLADKSAMKEMMNGDEWWAVASLVAGEVLADKGPVKTTGFSAAEVDEFRGLFMEQATSSGLPGSFRNRISLLKNVIPLGDNNVQALVHVHMQRSTVRSMEPIRPQDNDGDPIADWPVAEMPFSARFGVTTSVLILGMADPLARLIGRPVFSWAWLGISSFGLVFLALLAAEKIWRRFSADELKLCRKEVIWRCRDGLATAPMDLATAQKVMSFGMLGSRAESMWETNPERFRAWACEQYPQGAEDCLQRMSRLGLSLPGSRLAFGFDSLALDIKIDLFHFEADLVEKHWTTGQEESLFKALSASQERLVIGDMRWLNLELRRLKKKLKAKEQANLETRALAKKQSKDPRENLADFKRFLRQKHGGSLIRAWRMSLTEGDAMLLHKGAFFKACVNIKWRTDVKGLWEQLDRDNSGTIGIEELDFRAAEELALFRQFVINKFQNATQTFAALDLDGNKNVSEGEFMQALKEFGYENRDRIIFQALDKHGKKKINLEDMTFLDHWKPMEYLLASANQEAANAFKNKLRTRFGSYLRGWKLLLDVDGSNTCNWEEFRQACKRLGFKQDVAGCWRALDSTMSGTISLSNIDPASSSILQDFRTWAKREFGSVKSMFSASQLGLSIMDDCNSKNDTMTHLPSIPDGPEPGGEIANLGGAKCVAQSLEEDGIWKEGDLHPAFKSWANRRRRRPVKKQDGSLPALASQVDLGAECLARRPILLLAYVPEEGKFRTRVGDLGAALVHLAYRRSGARFESLGPRSPARKRGPRKVEMSAEARTGPDRGRSTQPKRTSSPRPGPRSRRSPSSLT
ncbi:RNA-dependent RNA polymerase 1 (AtRDRP1) (RNA-directed RNA polymerase 1) [Durusdinium trenchii]|uniref:RNA-dependent RNA polymerase 1 (AtRDRP1) (RNA-directed RNA polymerase 1) n=1 Tax=Durusdinium trenchii TaxID=1381693 RepID=A0ABP0PS49_9DINO